MSEHYELCQQTFRINRIKRICQRSHNETLPPGLVPSKPFSKPGGGLNFPRNFRTGFRSQNWSPSLEAESVGCCAEFDAIALRDGVCVARFRMPAPNYIEGFFKASNLAVLDNGSLLVDVDLYSSTGFQSNRLSEGFKSPRTDNWIGISH